MNDAQWWDMTAHRAIADGLDMPVRWAISYEDAADGCLPAGWYAQGLNDLGLPIVWPIRHEYGPFLSEGGAWDWAICVSEDYGIVLEKPTDM